MPEWDVDERGYGSSAVWDTYFRGLRDAGSDLDWRGRWTAPFLPLIDGPRVLDLGCGTGNELRALRDSGHDAVGLDFSDEALDSARAKRIDAPLVRADMAEPLPFLDDRFDAVMSNVAFHYFPDAPTRRILSEIRRILRPGGVLLLHVNAIEQREMQERRGVVVRDIGPNHVVNADGGTSRFFSGDYLSDLLGDWSEVELTFVPISDGGDPFKFVWRASARSPDPAR
jgi:SAM-dependent methyltransferase